MKNMTFLVKPASGLCNGRCRYCFYEDVAENRAVHSMGLMDADTARRLIRAAMEYVGPGGGAHFLFQGGEPALAGLDFFRDFVAAARKAQPEGARISYAIQTNGLALDGDWADFLGENRFLTGLSLDGSRALHDRYRRDSAGGGTWERAVRSLALLDRAGVETNLLCVITGDAARSPHRVWEGLTKLGAHSLQFIPCLDPLEGPRGQAPWSLTPEDYGRFLKGIFDLWYGQLAAGRYVSVRFFDDCLRLLAGMAPSTCAMAGRCGGYLAAEADGGLYPCDFYVLDEYCLGNIRGMTVAQALASPVMERFFAQGAARPQACARCPYGPLCRGGCRRDWVFSPAGPENYYCSAFRDFFAYALPRLRQAAGILFR